MSEEEYPPDYEPFHYAFEDVGLSAVYAPSGKVAHVYEPSQHGTRCGMDGWATWYGTGTQKERERAHELRLCKNCVARTPDRDLVKVPE